MSVSGHPRSLDGAAVPTPEDQLRIHDVFVFAGLELIGALAVTGNLCLIIVLLRNKYLNRASFILMLSLAVADVLHGICTTCYFYPPIVLKETVPEFVVRIFNIVDWTAWSITLTHMSAICLDRLIAIMLYGRYNQIVTVKRVRGFSVFCWCCCLSINILYFLFNFCCLIRPLPNSHFYTFGYDLNKLNDQSFLGPANVYMYTYTPTEIATLVILSISNPITLVQLYRRHKRKIALKQASTMLLEMSIRMGSKQVTNDVRELASRRANRQQQRILLQISVVAVIFYLYMTTYYLVYYIFETENKWVMLFNSFFYSTTHMINPIIYFSLNKEMRSQLVQSLNDFLACLCCVPFKPRTEYGSMIKPSTERKTSNKLENSITATETSPLFSSILPNNKPSAIAATVTKLRKSSFVSSLNQLVDASLSPSVSPGDDGGFLEDLKKPILNGKTNHTHQPDAESANKAKEQRQSLLDALIRALTDFTNQFSDDEGSEIVTAVLESHIKRCNLQSKSFDCSQCSCKEKAIRTSSTLNCLCLNEIAPVVRTNGFRKPETYLSPVSQAKSPLSGADSCSEYDSSTSANLSRLTKSQTWLEFSELKRTTKPKDVTRESLTMLLTEAYPDDFDEDENDIIYL